MPRMLTAAFAGIGRAARPCRRAGLSDPPGHHGDPVRGRRPDRRARPRGRGAHERNSRPAGGGRERRRRRRHDRLQARRRSRSRTAIRCVLGTVGTHAQGQTLYKKPLYNSVTDFTPVALLAEVPIVLTVRKDLPAEGLQGVRRLRQGKPGQDAVRLGRRGLGHASRLRAAQLRARDQHHARALSRHRTRRCRTCTAGRIDFLCEVITTAKPQIDGGTVKALAIFDKARSPALPNLRDRGRAGHRRTSKPIPGTRCSCRRTRPSRS